MAREVTRVYRDPLDELWLACAAEVGLRVRRTADAYASTDGRGTLSISTPEHLDADDCLAQMVFHELCHALVQGPDMALTGPAIPEPLVPALPCDHTVPPRREHKTGALVI